MKKKTERRRTQRRRTQRRRTQRQRQKKVQCKNIGSVQLEVDIIQQRIQEIKKKNMLQKE